MFCPFTVDSIRPDVANVTRGAPPPKDEFKENLYNTPNVSTPPMKTFYNKATVGPYATTTLITGNNMLSKTDNSAFRYDHYVVICTIIPLKTRAQIEQIFNPKLETPGFQLSLSLLQCVTI